MPAKEGKPDRHYTVDLIFGTHCFTQGIPKDGVDDQALHYRDGREVRLFDFRRFELSKTLPGVVETLVGRDCKHGERGNFFTVTQAEEDGTVIDYDIFFTVTRSSQPGRLNLFLQSAYVGATLPARPRRIRFEVILHNTLHKKPLR